MGRYVTQRLLLAGLTLLLVSVIVFTLLRVVVPLVYGDAVDIIAAEYGGTDPELVQQLKDDYGLSEEVADRLPVSLELGLVGLISSVLFSVPMGVAAAVAQNRWPDYFLRTSAILVDSIPGFWLAIMIITFGSIWFNWAPPLQFEYLQDDPIAHIKIMAMPALLIGLTPSGALIRLVRTQMLEVMRQDYIRTARAKGLTGRTVVMAHALRNALLPVVTVIGLSLPGLVAGTAIFESIFSLPGMGQYLVSSVGNLDYPVIMATVFIFSVLIVLSNLAVDLSYTIIDPRVRL
jgi:peptide/nickel transport system permease protein